MRIQLLGLILLFFAACTSTPRDTATVSTSPVAVLQTPPPNENQKKPRPRVLLVGLDGIGFDTFRKLQNGGHFREFRPVAPMVATFPSISDPNWSRLLRFPVEESYTKEHFDSGFKDPNGGFGRIVGGLIDQVENPAAYETYFDFKPEGFVAHLASIAWSVTTSRYWLESLEREFFKTDPSRDFAAFILNTDMIAHTKGERETLEFLDLLETKLKKIRSRHQTERKADLEIVLVSDHGNAFLSPRPIFPTEGLEKSGWSVTESINADNHVAFVFPEILSFAALYCRDSVKSKLARDMAGIEGVHTAFYLSAPNTVTFETPKGSAKAMVDPDKKTLRYEVVKGADPFEQARFFAKAKSLSWKAYFLMTIDTPYPYALVRAWEAFYVNSRQPAQVLVNPVLGYVFANKTLHLLTRFWGLKSVHGSLHRAETLGIAVSTHKSLSGITPPEFMDKIQLSR